MIMSPETPKPHCRSNKDQNQAFETHFDSICFQKKCFQLLNLAANTIYILLQHLNRCVPKNSAEIPISNQMWENMYLRTE